MPLLTMVLPLLVATPAVAQFTATPAPSLRSPAPGLPSTGPTYTIGPSGPGSSLMAPPTLQPSRPTDSLLTPRYEIAPRPLVPQYSPYAVPPSPSSRPGGWR